MVFSSTIIALACIGLTAAAPQRSDDIKCETLTYWDCQSSASGSVEVRGEYTTGLPRCSSESKKAGSSDMCLDDAGKVCTKKTGEKCSVTRTTTLKPGCEPVQEIECEKTYQDIASLPECGETGKVCRNVDGKPQCFDVSPKKCRDARGQLCFTKTATVCYENEVDPIILGEE